MSRFKSFALISKVLFEINSFARVEKTNSCSNTSKNAARLYFYKEQFLSYSRGWPFGFPLGSATVFRGPVLFETGAKVSHFSESPKDFGTFFKISQNRFLSPRSGVFLSKRVQR